MFRTILEDADLAAESVGTIAAARERLSADGPDLVMLDVGLPDGSGLDLVDVIRRQGEAAPGIVAVSGFAGDTVVRALAAGARDFLAKPINEVELVSRVRAVLDERRGR